MHKQKVLGMSHGGVFSLGTQKESIYLFFKNTSNANLLDVFYK